MRRRIPRVPCPIPGCNTEIPRTWLMCRQHWMSLAPADRRAHQQLYKEAKRAIAARADRAEQRFAINAFHRSCDARIAEATEKARRA